MDSKTLMAFMITVLSLLIVLFVSAAYFPSFFERYGITAFHNRPAGIFGDCWKKPGFPHPICRSTFNKKKYLAQKRARARLPIEYRKSRGETYNNTIRKPKITPLTY